MLGYARPPGLLLPLPPRSRGSSSPAAAGRSLRHQRATAAERPQPELASPKLPDQRKQSRHPRRLGGRARPPQALRLRTKISIVELPQRAVERIDLPNDALVGAQVVTNRHASDTVHEAAQLRHVIVSDHRLRHALPIEATRPQPGERRAVGAVPLAPASNAVLASAVHGTGVGRGLAEHRQTGTRPCHAAHASHAASL